MPTYDYLCDACGHEFELFQQMSDPVKRKCPKCGKPKLQRLIGTGAGVIFKGGGFYETDYRSENYKKAADEAKKAAEPKSEAKADTKSESKTDSKSDSKSDSKAESKSETKTEAKSATDTSASTSGRSTKHVVMNKSQCNIKGKTTKKRK